MPFPPDLRVSVPQASAEHYGMPSPRVATAFVQLSQASAHAPILARLHRGAIFCSPCCCPAPPYSPLSTNGRYFDHGRTSLRTGRHDAVGSRLQEARVRPRRANSPALRPWQACALERRATRIAANRLQFVQELQASPLDCREPSRRMTIKQPEQSPPAGRRLHRAIRLSRPNWRPTSLLLLAVSPRPSASGLRRTTGGRWCRR